MKPLHVGVSPITNRIYAGHVLKDGKTWAADQQDVTGAACGAVCEHVLANKGPVTVTRNGEPAFRITVDRIDAKQPAPAYQFSQRPDGWYFVGDDQDTYGPYASQLDAAVAWGGYMAEYHTNPFAKHKPRIEAKQQNIEAELHKVVKRFLSKRQQGYVMGAIRQLLADAESACNSKAPFDEGALFTHDKKGGRYRLLGGALGSGPLHGQQLIVYRDTNGGQLYFRQPQDFAQRMIPISEPLRKTTP